MKGSIVVFIGVFALLLSGCILLPVPHNQWISPRFYGQVADAESGKGIVGARIALSGYRYGQEGATPVVVTTDREGRYSVVAKRHSNWLPVWLGPAEGTQMGVLTIECEGYETATIKKSRFGGAMERMEFKVDVALKRHGPNRSRR